MLCKGAEGLSSSGFTRAADSCSSLPDILEKRKGKVQGDLGLEEAFPIVEIISHITITRRLTTDMTT